jgi:uncharacterized membrane protein YoaK (UPF0700 family)
VPGRNLALLMGLSVIAGVTDVTSLLVLGGFFSAHLLGNVVIVTVDLVVGTSPDPAAVLAVPLFWVTAAAAGAIARRRGPRAPTNALLDVQAAFLCAAAALSFATPGGGDPRTRIGLAAAMCAVCAMAAQNAYLHLVPTRTITTSVLLGNVRAAVAAAIERSTNVPHAPREPQDESRRSPSVVLVAGFAAGCLLGAVSATTLREHAALIPAVLGLAVALSEPDRRVVPG